MERLKVTKRIYIKSKSEDIQKDANDATDQQDTDTHLVQAASKNNMTTRYQTFKETNIDYIYIYFFFSIMGVILSYPNRAVLKTHKHAEQEIEPQEVEARNHSVYSTNGTLVTSNKDVIQHWKEQFEEPLNLIGTSSFAAEVEDNLEIDDNFN